MKNKPVIWLIAFFLIVITSCKKDKVLTITGFTASEGTHVGVVRLTYEPIAGAEAYEMQRKNLETNTWEQILYVKSFVPDQVYDDKGGSSVNTGYTLIPGQAYEYRMKAWASEGYEPSAWSAVATGYIFAPSPRMTRVNYAPDTIYFGDGVFTFTFKDKLPAVLSNLINRTVKIYRSKATISDFNQLYLNDNSITGNDSTFYVTGTKDNDDAPYDYKFELSYNYSCAEVEENGSNLNGRGSFIYTSFIITSDDLNK